MNCFTKQHVFLSVSIDHFRPQTLYHNLRKKKHISSFHFLFHCNPNKGKRNTLFSFIFFFSSYFQTYTRQLISFFFCLIFLLLFVSFSCLVFPLFSLVFWKKILFLTLVNANNTSFSTHKSSIFMCQLLIEF